MIDSTQNRVILESYLQKSSSCDFGKIHAFGTATDIELFIKPPFQAKLNNTGIIL